MSATACTSTGSSARTGVTASRTSPTAPSETVSLGHRARRRIDIEAHDHELCEFLLVQFQEQAPFLRVTVHRLDPDPELLGLVGHRVEVVAVRSHLQRDVLVALEESRREPAHRVELEK